MTALHNEMGQGGPARRLQIVDVTIFRILMRQNAFEFQLVVGSRLPSSPSTQSEAEESSGTNNLLAITKGCFRSNVFTKS